MDEEFVRKVIEELPETVEVGGDMVACNKLYILDKLGFGGN